MKKKVQTKIRIILIEMKVNEEKFWPIDKMQSVRNICTSLKYTKNPMKFRVNQQNQFDLIKVTRIA